MISTKYPSNSSLTSDDEVEIVAISTNVAGKKPFIMIYGDQTVQSTNFHSGALEITETQMLLPNPDFEPEIKIERSQRLQKAAKPQKGVFSSKEAGAVGHRLQTKQPTNR
jgi:hypothetical protein